ncbi:MAG: protein translocase subunit SecD [Deltaproteobacteria bacterium]|nr:protein translocase subunit SecD [Deltaproteobacteria bacterium]
MKGKLGWRAILVLAVLVASVVYLVPSISGNLPLWWSNVLPKDKVQLGLDLQGGMHLILEVESEKAVETQLGIFADDIKRALREERVWIAGDKVQTSAGAMELVLKNEEDIEKLKEFLEKNYPEFSIEETRKDDSGVVVTLAMSADEQKRIRQFATSQALETIRNRVDQFGVSEPDIRPQGEDRLLIQLPGISDTDRALKLIGKTALLEFKLVDDMGDLPAAEKGDVPPGDELLYEVRENRETGRVTKTPVLVERRSLLTGQYVSDARVQIDNQFNEPYVTLKFNAKGARLFERVTGENVKRRLAIILDGVVNSAPVIQEKIPGGTARITGNFTMEEARDLAIVLRAGALPAPVKVLEERTVGPSLGKDSIRKGFISMIVGGLVVILVMAVYYQIGGLIADAALLLNIVLIMAALAAFGATLTLPGMAGIILTIGMAVDANVLIFERIREETRLGKTPRAAVEAGFGRALVTIIDSNVTTLIAALVLFQFGTGPVKGFAVTLSIGIVASVFTAVFVSRLVFDYLLLRVRVKRIPV